MVTELSERIEELKKIDFQSDGWVPKLEAELEQIVQTRDPDCIQPLTQVFDDKAKYDEGMFSIVHSIEVFDDEPYVEALIKSMPDFCKSAPRWASIVLMRTLNSTKTSQVLEAKIRHADPSQKESMRWMAERINEVSAEFHAKTAGLLDALDS